MAARVPNASLDSTGTALLAQFPPRISLSSHLLGSVISLPLHPRIAFSAFAAQDTHAIELARRNIIAARKPSATDSLLSSVRISKDSSLFYVFAISSSDSPSDSHKSLHEFTFDGLELTQSSAFTPDSLYPCSSQCADLLSPCPSCLSRYPTSAPSPSARAIPPCAACLYPRRPLRLIYAQFLQAVRERLIDDIVEASKGSGRAVKRFRNGFVLGPPSSPGEWSSGWEHHAQCRPLIYVHLHLHLSPTRLTLKPLLRPSPFHPLPLSLPFPSPSLPSAGTPITLLPYGTPAYFLTTYSGPTSVLTAQFQSSLVGLGAGEWAGPPPYINLSTNGPAKVPTYVIAWVGVQNRQGEEKGVTAVWPARLCLAFHPSAGCPRQPLSYLPELPAELQPSPPPPPPPSSSMQVDEDVPPIANNSNLTPIRPNLRRTGAYTSPAGETLRAFRALTIARSKEVEGVAGEAGAYVDAVVKERERERERARRERGAAGMSSPSRARVAPTPREEETPVFPESSPAVPRAEEASDSPMMVDRELGVGVGVGGAGAAQGEATPMESNPPEMSTSPLVDAEELARDSVSPDPIAPSQGTYDGFSTFDNNWTQSSGDYMSFGMGGIGYGGMDLGMGGTGTGTGGGAGQMGMGFGVGAGDGFDVFTDDDFSFFDKPAAGAGGGTVAGLGVETGVFGAEGNVARSPVKTQSSPWAPAGLGEGLTPRFGAEGHGHGHGSEQGLAPPELDPSSPAGTPSAYSDPPTPTVQLVVEGRPPDARSQLLLGVPGIFDPIPFAGRHRVADEKYAMGKFAIAVARKEEEGRFREGKGWRYEYTAVTDPRVGVVRQLIGVKRKSLEQGMREMKLSPAWIREPEDWEPCTPEEKGEEDRSEPESEEEDEQWMEEDESRSVSRPSTPVPSYLPLGPTLLETRFQHSQLLPVSSTLRPPGAVVAALSLPLPSAPPLNVPTPVSPAAALGASSEKSKSLEAAAHMFAKELVENPVWAEACRVRGVDEDMQKKLSTGVWQSDAVQVLQLVGKCEACSPMLELKDVVTSDVSGSSARSADHPILQIMKPPSLTLSKSDAIVQMHYTALRFWEKLGLGPRSGKKDVSAFVFFEDEGDARAEQVEWWLNKVSLLYNAKNLGSHVAGASPGCVKDGLVPIKLESIRKTLISFVSTLDPNLADHIVFYVVTPPSIMTLSSPVLRQIFSATKRTVKTHSDRQILFHLVPEHLILASLDDSIGCSPFDPLVLSVYDRILRPVDRVTARPDIDQTEPRRSYIQDPAFVGSRPLRNTARFLREPRLHTLDVVDRHTLLHAGYRVSECGKWLVATTTDQRGEGYEIGVWLYPGESKEEQLVGQVWGFACQMARKASVDWRVVVTKLGLMSEGEIQAWMSHLRMAVTDSPDMSLQATVMVAEQGTSWTFLAPERKPSKAVSPQRSASKDNHHSVFVDVSSTTYSLYPSECYAFPSVQPLPDFHDEPSHIREFNEDTPSEDLGALPSLSSTLVYVPAGTDHTSINMLNLHLLHSASPVDAAYVISDEDTLRDVTNNFYELALLAQARHISDAPVLPLHLAALEKVQFAQDVDVVE